VVLLGPEAREVALGALLDQRVAEDFQEGGAPLLDGQLPVHRDAHHHDVPRDELDAVLLDVKVDGAVHLAAGERL